jgi:hypothetical protein
MAVEESTEGGIGFGNLLRLAHREIMKGVHTMLPGVVDEFDSATQRAKVAIATAQQTYKGDKLSFPPLINVPVQFFRWGGFTISMPVKPGDECAIYFSERSMDLFLDQGGVDKVPVDGRFFDLSDAFIVPGLNSNGNIVPDYDNSNMVFKSDNGATVFTLTEDGRFSIENSTAEFVTTVSDLLGVLDNEVAVVTSGSSSGNWPLKGNIDGVYAALKTKIDSFKR